MKSAGSENTRISEEVWCSKYLALSWSAPDFHIDLGFYGNGKFSFYGAKEGRAPIVRDEVPVKDGIPGDLVNFASTV